MKQIHFIGGEKGGVGKSVMARLLAQYYIDRDIDFRGYDTDLSHGAMMRYYRDFSEAIDMSQFQSADRIIEQTVENDHHAIVDMAAQTAKPLYHWVMDAGLLEVAEELDTVINFWHVMDDGSDTLMLLQNLLNDYGKQAHYIVVRNYGRGSNFAPFDNSATARQAEQNGARMIDLPALHPPTMQKIDHISASFWAAANNSDSSYGPTLGILERQRVRTWLNRTYEQLDQILLPAETL